MNPEEAYQYVKKCGLSEEIRNAACQSAHFAYYYAKNVNKEPKENTRNAACENPYYAYLYAKDVDKGFHEDTQKAVQNTEYEEKYKEFINSNMKEEII